MSKQHEQALMLLRKAGADLALLEEVISSKRVADEVIGFHGQQAVEKLLKALLSESGVVFARTHNLRLLADLLSDAGQPLPAELAEVDGLTPFGTLYRYEEIPLEQTLDRAKALHLVRTLQSYVERRLQPPARRAPPDGGAARSG